ncbi:hypothetical protein PENVUL_c004G07862 [Penicillium vulpinum]|uniref:LITAF domain-containing protein n=1 Tax=Penicillium vulpinum TaxID=29845 RepID=A0A1V6S9E5_9EURO|nr:hypothetical protein PENVUL_c004G07862 [Penicillium vulpinum]
MPLHPDQTPKPAPIYSDDPEVVFPNQPSQGPVSPSSDTYSHTTQSLLDALRSSYATTPINRPPERQYPNQPDSIGQELACDTPQSMPAPSEKAYPGQPLPQQGQGYLQPFYTPSCHPSGYSSAVPLHSLQSASCPVDCPVCEQREMTRIEPVSGGTTQ